MVFNQKQRKSIIFSANSSKNTQGYCQPTNESICYNLPLHTHNEDHFHHPQILKYITSYEISRVQFNIPHSPIANPIDLSSSTIQRTPQTPTQQNTSIIPSDYLG